MLCYGAEIWGFLKSFEVEKVHINACKLIHILDARKKSCNSAVYCELGIILLEIFRKQKNYWILVKIKKRKKESIILDTTYSRIYDAFINN